MIDETEFTILNQHISDAFRLISEQNCLLHTEFDILRGQVSAMGEAICDALETKIDADQLWNALHGLADSYSPEIVDPRMIVSRENLAAALAKLRARGEDRTDV